MNNTLSYSPSPEHGAVVLPCAPEDFTTFIKGLLGKPQEIAFSVSGVFSIALDDIVDLHHIVHQRITGQDKSSLVSFSVRVIYDNGSSVLLNSLDALQSYRETRNIISTQAHLSWTYLVHFPDGSAPEKQDIEVSCYATEAKLLPSQEIARRLPASTPIELTSRGHIDLRIKHTKRTWGADLEGI